jgi:hypothetical protein
MEVQMKLTEKKRDELKSLLEDHEKAIDALRFVRRSTWSPVLEVVHDDGQDSVTVPLNYLIAERVLREQKQWIEKELGKLGIEIG